MPYVTAELLQHDSHAHMTPVVRDLRHDYCTRLSVSSTRLAYRPLIKNNKKKKHALQCTQENTSFEMPKQVCNKSSVSCTLKYCRKLCDTVNRHGYSAPDRQPPHHYTDNSRVSDPMTPQTTRGIHLSDASCQALGCVM